MRDRSPLQTAALLIGAVFLICRRSGDARGDDDWAEAGFRRCPCASPREGEVGASVHAEGEETFAGLAADQSKSGHVSGSPGRTSPLS